MYILLIYLALPKGIELDIFGGAITGVPQQELPLTKFTVTAQNGLGKTTAVINLHIIRLYCPETVDYPQSDLNEIVTIHCKGQSGYKIRKCVYYNGRVQWGEEDEHCGSSKPIPTSLYVIIILLSLSVLAAVLVIVVFRVKRREIENDDEVPISLEKSDFYNRIIRKSEDDLLLYDD